MDATLKQVSRAARRVNNPDVKVVRCIGSSQCHKQWAWPRNQSRVLSHVANCSWVPGELRHEATIKLAAKASKTASQQASKRKQGDSNNAAGEESARSDGEKSGEHNFKFSNVCTGVMNGLTHRQAPEPKRARMDVTVTTKANSLPPNPSPLNALEQNARATGK